MGEQVPSKKLSSGPWKVAIGSEQAMENWLVARTGHSIEHNDEVIYITTDHVHASMAESYPFEDAEFIVRCRNYALEHGDPIDVIERLQRENATHRATIAAFTEYHELQRQQDFAKHYSADEPCDDLKEATRLLHVVNAWFWRASDDPDSARVDPLYPARGTSSSRAPLFAAIRALLDRYPYGGATSTKGEGRAK